MPIPAFHTGKYCKAAGSTVGLLSFLCVLRQFTIRKTTINRLNEKTKTLFTLKNCCNKLVQVLESINLRVTRGEREKTYNQIFQQQFPHSYKSANSQNRNRNESSVHRPASQKWMATKV